MNEAGAALLCSAEDFNAPRAVSNTLAQLGAALLCSAEDFNTLPPAYSPQPPPWCSAAMQR